MKVIPFFAIAMAVVFGVGFLLLNQDQPTRGEVSRAKVGSGEANISTETSSSQESKDQENLNRAYSQDSESGWRAYLETCVSVSPCKGRQTARREIRRHQDYRAWARASNTDTISAYRSYLNQFPNGDYGSAAQRGIDAINRLAQQAAEAERAAEQAKREAAARRAAERAAEQARREAAARRAAQERYTHVTCRLNPRGDNYLSLRSYGSTSARELDRMGPNTRVMFLERSGSWYKIRTSYGRVGWAYSKYLCSL